ncbi:glycosyltransferase 87 family protein [bacterium]|nr:glycosyltransferase 87 family protein [bacterium]
MSNPLRYERYFRGYCIFAGAAMLAVSTWGGKLHRHYAAIFSGATHDFFNGINPYHKAYDALGAGSYFHFAPASFAVFAPFVYLPPTVGNFLYISLSLFVFFTGVFKALDRLRATAAPWSAGFFYLMLSSEIVGSVMGSKIEILSAGILLHAFLLLLDGKRLFLGSFLLGLVFSWKLQPAPVVGLLVLSFLLKGKRAQLPTVLGGGLLAFTLSWGWPFTVMPTAFVLDCYRLWFATLSEIFPVHWTHHEGIYQFAKGLTGWPSAYSQVQAISLVGAGLYALWIVALWRRGAALPHLLWGAFGLGASYMVLFTPLGQGMAFILGTPLVLLVAMRAGRKGSLLPSWGWALALFIHWYVASLNYSDLVPGPWRFQGPWRVGGYLLLTVLFAWDFLTEKPSKQRK